MHPDFNLRNGLLDHMKQRWLTVTPTGECMVIAGMLRDNQIELALDRMDRLVRNRVPIPPWLNDMACHILCDYEEISEALRLMQTRVDTGDLVISPNCWYHLLDVGSRTLHVSLQKH